jgi:DNA-binding beta-propeller fold protein YncE
MWGGRSRVLVLVLMGLCLSFPAHARAAVESGALSQASPFDCVGEPPSEEEQGKGEEAESAKCATQVPSGLSFAYQLEVSPDGKDAYSVAVSGAVIEYERNQANGALSEIGCFSSISKSEPACASENAEMEVAAVGDPAAIAISPDGASVYVIGQLNNTIAEFSRNAKTGLLTKSGCITHESTLSECETTGAKGLDLPYGITVSPDGENVYVTGFGEEAVAEFKRNTETGALTQLASPNECIGDAASGCGTLAIGLEEDIGVAVSPDGKNVYVAAGAKEVKGDVAEFARGAEGALEQLPGEEGCVSEKVAGCKVLAHVDGSEDLVISPDGANVYANSYPGGESAVIEFKRTESGELEALAANNECVSTETLAGCTKAKRVGGPLGLAISPDGEDVYAGSANENSVAEFKRGAEGALEQLATNPCVTDEASGCGAAEDESNRVGLKFARRLTVSPDGTNVYVAGQAAHAIVEFSRTVKPTVSRIDLSYGSPEGATEVHIKGTGFAQGAKVIFGGVEAASVTVNSATSITAFSPAGAEATVAVRVENEVGTSTEVPADLFTYSDKPVVTGVTASLGGEAGGSIVTITGSEFAGAEAVHFGSSPAASVTVDSADSITATSPPGSGTVDVTVTTPNGTSKTGAADKYSYVDGKPVPLSGLFLVGYCGELGDTAVTLGKEDVGGIGFAYENWACVESDGAEVPIANTGPAPSMADACRAANPGVASYAYAENPNNAYSWGCYEVEPPAPAKEKGSSTTATATIATSKAPPATAAAVLPPTLAKTGNVAPLSGTVLVKLPGAKTFVPLASLRQIPFGTVIEATHGHVSVTTALPHGGTQTGEFFEGEFILTQGPNGMVVATLTGGNFSVCPTKRERLHIARSSAAHASGKHVVRKLWANAHGSFSTKGNYAAGAVQGTEWLTEDLCEGTLIRVTRDKVAVTNLVNHRHVEVKVGHHYLAKAP